MRWWLKRVRSYHGLVLRRHAGQEAKVSSLTALWCVLSLSWHCSTQCKHGPVQTFLCRQTRTVVRVCLPRLWWLLWGPQVPAESQWFTQTWPHWTRPVKRFAGEAPSLLQEHLGTVTHPVRRGGSPQTQAPRSQPRVNPAGRGPWWSAGRPARLQPVCTDTLYV